MTEYDVLKVRIAHLEAENDDLKAKCDKLEERLRCIEQSHGKLSERMTIFQLGQAFFTAAASTVSAIFSNFI